jgi:membrane protease YdiL (CAAX protease family)
MKAERNNEPFTFRMTSGEAAAAVLYLPVHIWLLPRLLLALPETRELSELSLNLLVYGIGAVTMLLLLGRYLRREFDPLADHPLNILFQVLVCYGMMLAFHMMMNAVLTLLLPDNLANPNNSAVLELADREFGKTTAMAVFLAPLVEEPIFRGGIFGALRPRSRPAAYVAGMLLFSLYHVWGYALQNPAYWIYLLEYLPASWLLCRCYERCDSIWGSIFLHMLINGVSILTAGLAA